MRVTYDPTADALAIELAPEAQTARMVKLAPTVNADFDARGRLVTIEILNASAWYPPEQLEGLPSAVEYLSLAEAAEESGLSHDTLRRQIHLKRLPAEKRGRDWVVPRHELLNYLENRDPRGRPARRRKARRTRAAAKKLASI